jgi:NADH:ubiquinone oxidoreductase subunit H
MLLVLAPLVLATSSLRPFDLVLFQQGSFAPLALLGDGFMGVPSAGLEALRVPNWFVFRQPLTAILIIPTLGLLLQRNSVFDTLNNTSGMSGFGLDSDPNDLYWMGVESRLSAVLAAAIFVTFFLGAGSVPYFDPHPLLAALEPILGQGFPALLLAGFEFSVFGAKLLLVLLIASLLRRSTGRARSDQALQLMTRRLIPLAWANLLLLSALSLLSGPAAEGLR